jgi:hypothetical protein
VDGEDLEFEFREKACARGINLVSDLKITLRCDTGFVFKSEIAHTDAMPWSEAPICVSIKRCLCVTKSEIVLEVDLVTDSDIRVDQPYIRINGGQEHTTDKVETFFPWIDPLLGFPVIWNQTPPYENKCE